jgi:hypothetical protein
MGDAICSLNDAKCSLNDAICSLNDAICSLNNAICSLKHSKCSLNDAHIESTLFCVEGLDDLGDGCSCTGCTSGILGDLKVTNKPQLDKYF